MFLVEKSRLYSKHIHSTSFSMMQHAIAFVVYLRQLFWYNRVCYPLCVGSKSMRSCFYELLIDSENKPTLAMAMRPHWNSNRCYKNSFFLDMQSSKVWYKSFSPSYTFNLAPR